MESFQNTILGVIEKYLQGEVKQTILKQFPDLEDIEIKFKPKFHESNFMNQEKNDHETKKPIIIINYLEFFLEKQKNPIIKLDLDSENELNEFLNRAWIIKYLGISVKDIEVYDTKHGYHIYIYTDNIFTNVDIIILQLLLGSDYRKEFYSYLKLKNGSSNFNVLFERKYVYNHLDHEIELSKEEFNDYYSRKFKEELSKEDINPSYSKKIKNVISFGDERNTGIFKKKANAEPDKVEHNIKEE